MATSTLGALGEAIFGQPKLKKVFGNEPLNERFTGSYITALDDLRNQSIASSKAFGSALDAATPEATRLNTEDIGTLGRLANKRESYDPLADYDRLLEAKTSSLRSFVPDIMGSLNANLARKRLGLGISGSAPTTYDTVAGLSSLGSGLAPILNNIYGTTGAEMSAASAARSGGLADLVNLLGVRRGLPDQLAYRSLAPAQASSALLADELGLAQGLGEATAQNIQGFRTDSNKWANLMNEAGNELQSYVQSFAGGAGGAIGGGMGGGMGSLLGMIGGGSKGGGGSGRTVGYYNPSGFVPSSGTYYAPGYRPQYSGPPLGGYAMPSLDAGAGYGGGYGGGYRNYV